MRDHFVIRFILYCQFSLIFILLTSHISLLFSTIFLLFSFLSNYLMFVCSIVVYSQNCGIMIEGDLVIVIILIKLDLLSFTYKSYLSFN